MSRAHYLAAVASGFALLAALHSTALAQAATPVAHLATRADTTHHARATRVHRAKGKASLRAQAKISEDSARTIALAQAPGATLGKATLESEHGRVIYAFAVKSQDAAMKGMKEVEVDAVNGQVLPRESAATEHREMRKETRKAESHEAKPAANMKVAPAKPAAVRKP